MNRDKVIIVLVPLLIASLACNWWLWTRGPKSGEIRVSAGQTVSPASQTSPPPEHGAQGPNDTPPAVQTDAMGDKKSAPHDLSSPGAYEIVPNPVLKGRLGRLLVTFPADTKISGTRTGVHQSGNANEIEAKYGNVQIELIPGTYDVFINGQVVAGVTIQSHQDTRIHVGVLRLSGSSSTRFGIYAPGGAEELQAKYGDNDVGLPVGEYDVSIKDVRERVKITAGTITEF